MIVIEKETGTFVPYVEDEDTKLTFNDELMLNLSKYERDFEQILDICVDENKCLAMGLAKNYVAQVVIPARQYTAAVPGETEEDEGTPAEAIALDMETVTLFLWNTEGMLV